MMRLGIFGASGRTGQEVLRLAGSRGWSVRALVRPDSHGEAGPGVEVLRGSLESASDVLATVGGVDAVCCVFGPRSPQAEPFCAPATARIISAMQSAGPRRLLCLTGAMVGELGPNLSVPMRTMAAVFRRQYPELAADAAAQERAVIGCDLEWTVVKPPRLTIGPATHRIRAGRALGVGLLSHISRGDLAAFMLDEVLASQHLRERVYVCV